MSIQLAPDIEAGLRAEAAARGMDVDSLIATAVGAYLREAAVATPTSSRAPSRDRSAEMTWAANPDAQYFGKWVVLDGKQVGSKRLESETTLRGRTGKRFLVAVPDLRFSRRSRTICRRMDRLISLDFDTDLEYKETFAGILVPIRLIHGDRSVELSARLDTGAADCLFDRSYADVLGLSNSGVEREYRTVTGSFKAFGHEVRIQTLGLEWSALVFFHAIGNPAYAFVGRRGWLDRIRLGIVHYEQRLFVGQYSR